MYISPEDLRGVPHPDDERRAVPSQFRVGPGSTERRSRGSTDFAESCAAEMESDKPSPNAKKHVEEVNVKDGR